MNHESMSISPTTRARNAYNNFVLLRRGALHAIPGHLSLEEVVENTIGNALPIALISLELPPRLGNYSSSGKGAKIIEQAIRVKMQTYQAAADIEKERGNERKALGWEDKASVERRDLERYLDSLYSVM